MIPLRLNPVPLIPTLEIVTLDPPVLVTIPLRACFLPIVTLPKLRLVGFDPRVPNATPVPAKGLEKEEFEASEIIVTVPEALPVACGAKETVKVALWDGSSVSGRVSPLI